MNILDLFRRESKTIDNIAIEGLTTAPILEHTKDKQIKKDYINNECIKEGLQAALTASGITYDQENKEKPTYKINVKKNPEKKDDKTKNQQSEENLELSISPDIAFAIALSYKRISDYDESFLDFFKENIGAALKYGVVVKTYEESETNNKERKLRSLTDYIKTYENSGLTGKYFALAQVANTAARKTSSFAPKYF